MKFEKFQDIISGCAVAAFAVIGLAYLVPVGVKSPPNIKVQALAPAFWPSIILWMMLLLAAFILVKGVLDMKRDMAAEVPDDVEGGGVALRVARTIAAVALLFIYQASIEVVGMVAASIVVGLAFTFLAGERRYKFFVPISVLLPIALYYFFTKVAAVPIPLGVFETLEF